MTNQPEPHVELAWGDPDVLIDALVEVAKAAWEWHGHKPRPDYRCAVCRALDALPKGWDQQ